jgi:hypothetical protein
MLSLRTATSVRNTKVDNSSNNVVEHDRFMTHSNHCLARHQSTMTTVDEDLVKSLCRQISITAVSADETESVSLIQNTEQMSKCRFEFDDGVGKLKILPSATYNMDELTRLSRFIGKASRAELKCLELDGIDGLDWSEMLGHDNCSLRELVVAIRSQRALRELASALCCNKSVVRFDMEYKIESNITTIPSDEHGLAGVDTSDDFAFINHNLLLEAINPMQQVVFKGISTQHCPTSFGANSTPCTWQKLTLKDCDVTHTTQSWIEPSIGTLQELVLTNCRVTCEIIQNLSDSYLEFSTRGSSSRIRKRKKTRKAPLRVLNLSDNIWAKEASNRDEKEENQARFVYDRYDRSPLSSLASWMDSLSNLVELNLSNSTRLFSDRSKGMDDLCGTVNHSLRRLSLRHCGLRTNDLPLLVSTFCWLEALDLSENASLLRDLFPLLNLEHLTELVLENMSENGIEEGVISNVISRDPSKDDVGLGAFLRALGREEQRNCEYVTEDNASRPRRHLERLNLSGNVLDRDILKSIPFLHSLRVLILVSCQMESGGLIELLAGERYLAEGRTFPWRELYLGSNNIGDDGALALARSLKCQYLRSLRVLQLESNVFSVNAMKAFVQEGLAYSLRLESLILWNVGAHTTNQLAAWQEVEKKMDHYLSLNEAGREVLYMDKCAEVETEKLKDVNNQNTIPSHMWPILLQEADRVYGANALFYFLNKRPDLILASQEKNRSRFPLMPVNLHSPGYSPRGVADATYEM